VIRQHSAPTFVHGCAHQHDQAVPLGVTPADTRPAGVEARLLVLARLGLFVA
jgi:hypothetical protein